MSDDSELLHAYDAEKSEQAFADLVGRHLGFVYQTAMRHTNGDAHAARDISQLVFADLARKSHSLAQRTQIVGWLYKSTRYAALQWLRGERRRIAREKEAQLMGNLIQEPGPVAEWERLRPEIDEALDSLSPTERDAVLLRFFEGFEFAEVGARLDLSAQGARSKVERALGKMQGSLARRGLGSTASAIGAALATQAAPVAPLGLAAAIANVALVGPASVSTGMALTLGTLQAMKISSLFLAGSLAANAVLGGLAMRDRATTSSVPPLDNGMPVTQAAAPDALKGIYDPDPAVFLSHLRAAGLPANVQRALIEAALDEEFRQREEALKPKPPAEWWHWQDPRVPVQNALALLDLRREKARIREQLLGPEPDTFSEDSPYYPVAPEKRAMLKAIAEDYSVMLASAQAGPPAFRLPAEQEQIKLLQDQRRKDLTALLTPEELAAYDARTWSNLPMVTYRLRYFEPTDAEYAAIHDAIADHVANTEATRRSGPADDEAEEGKILAVLSDQRFEEYDQSRRQEFRELQSLLVRSGRQASDVKPVYELWKGIETESHRINDDSTMTHDEKLQALKNLSAQTRILIVQALGPEIGDAYINARAFTWLATVARGTVISFTSNGDSGAMVDSPFVRPSASMRRSQK